MVRVGPPGTGSRPPMAPRDHSTVNITNVAGASCGSGGRAAITTADAAQTRQALQTIHATFQELEITDVSLADQPGSLAKATRRLASAGVNVEAILPMGMTG